MQVVNGMDLLNVIRDIETRILTKPFRVAVLISSIAFLIRVAFIVFYTPHPLAGGDPTAFWTYAEGIANGQGFRSTFEPWLADRPPLYSYFLAGIFLLGGKTQQTVFFVQAALAAVAAGVFYLGTTRVLDKFGSLVAGILFAVFPAILLFTQQILTEAIYIPIWVFLLVSLIYVREKSESKRLLLGAGITLGLLALVRREAILPGGIMAITLLWLATPYQWGKLLQRSVIIFIMAGLVILPWLVRNYYVLGEPVLSSSGGINFMVGNNPMADGAYSPPPLEWQAQFQGLTELERDQKAWALSLQWVRENPGDFFSLLPKKFMTLWGPAHNFVLDWADIGLLLLCLPGLLRILQRRERWELITVIFLVPVLTTTLVGLTFVGLWRYRLLVYPGLIILAGYGSMQILSWYGAFRSSFQKRHVAPHS